MQPEPAFTSMISVLLPIWQRVLQRSSLQWNDNFFDCGGTPALAEALFAEVKRTTGREFPAVSIYHMSNPGEMTLALLEEPGKQRFLPPVLMKAGKKDSPIFFAHGISSNLLEYRDLVEQVQTERAIFGIQSRGIYGIEKPHRSIEDMAGYHLEAIRRTQGQGPYSLIGYSLGGLVMLEVARTLLSEGERVSLLVLIDSYPYRTHLKLAQQMRLYSQLAIRRIGKMLRLKSPVPSAELGPLQEMPGVPSENNGNLRLWFEREREDAYTALRSYEPKFYDGTIKFIRAEIPTRFPDNPKAVWTGLAKKLEVETSAGDHRGLVNLHIKPLTAKLSRYLAESNAQTGA
jgi:thioesterase domain-containing protein